jgi:hypothetical protein
MDELDPGNGAILRGDDDGDTRAGRVRVHEPWDLPAGTAGTG